MKIGIDLGGTNVRIGQVVKGEVVRKWSLPSPGKMPLDKSLSYLISGIRDTITPETEGIGIGVPSVVDVAQGIVYNVANIPAWEEVPLVKILSEEFHLPVFVNNDCNCFAIGEKTFGKGKPYANVVAITLGTGVGAGIIINNELYNGANTGAGEIGCLPYLQHTYEYYCGSEFFKTIHHTTGDQLAERARQGEETAIHKWKEFGCHMGNLMQAILFTYDPEAVIIGGGISAAYDLFAPSMWDCMKNFPYPKTVENIHIHISEHPDISILGAAALIK